VSARLLRSSEWREGSDVGRKQFNSPLTKLLPVHSTPVVTTTLHEFPLAQVMLVLVLTLKLPPLGTSGVLVVVMTQTKSSKSTCADSSVMRHFVCLGPIEPLRGLM
jgi:hypothetical protein